MTVRHVVLAISGLAVLGLGIYLFFEVHAAPATAEVTKHEASTRTVDPEPEQDSGTKPASETARRKRHDLEALRMRVDHGKRAAPNRPGRAENGDVLHDQAWRYT